MSGLTRKDFDKALGVKVEQVPLGNSYVNVRELTCQEFRELAELTGPLQSEVDEKTLVWCLRDDDGNPLFNDASDLRANFKVGLSTFRELAQKVFDLSKPAKKN